jgi:hypothetical protein
MTPETDAIMALAMPLVTQFAAEIAKPFAWVNVEQKKPASASAGRQKCPQ